jgi:hypothetical protein
MEAAILGRDHEREVVPDDDGVGPRGPVPELDLVPPEPDPGIGVHDVAGERADIRVIGHAPIVARGSGRPAQGRHRRRAMPGHGRNVSGRP